MTQASTRTLVPARPTFAGIPQELRRIIYQLFLDEHYLVKRQTQPTNAHLRLLQTCRFVYNEAHDLLWRYLSLQTEAQIIAFVDAVDERHAQLVQWSDVACDNRVYRDPTETSPFLLHPVSQLHLALKKMSNLRQLRTFEPKILPKKRPGLKLYRYESEKALCYPSGWIPGLTKYELYRTNSGAGFTNLFRHLAASSLHTLRLSGVCYVAGDPPSFKHLHELVVYRLACDEFPNGGLAQFFADARLNSFVFVQGSQPSHAGNTTASINDRRDGMVLNDKMIADIVDGPARDARELTLLRCRRGTVTLAGIAACLKKLSNLEYLALGYDNATATSTASSAEDLKCKSSNEDTQAFLENLPPTLRTLKLSVPDIIANQNASGSHVPAESSTLFDDLARRIFVDRQFPCLSQLCIFVEGATVDPDLRRRWKDMAQRVGIEVGLVDWTDAEEARL